MYVIEETISGGGGGSGLWKGNCYQNHSLQHHHTFAFKPPLSMGAGVQSPAGTIGAPCPALPAALLLLLLMGSRGCEGVPPAAASAAATASTAAAIAALCAASTAVPVASSWEGVAAPLERSPITKADRQPQERTDFFSEDEGETEIVEEATNTSLQETPRVISSTARTDREPKARLEEDPIIEIDDETIAEADKEDDEKYGTESSRKSGTKVETDLRGQPDESPKTENGDGPDVANGDEGGLRSASEADERLKSGEVVGARIGDQEVGRSDMGIEPEEEEMGKEKETIARTEPEEKADAEGAPSGEEETRYETATKKKEPVEVEARAFLGTGPGWENDLPYMGDEVCNGEQDCDGVQNRRSGPALDWDPGDSDSWESSLEPRRHRKHSRSRRLRGRSPASATAAAAAAAAALLSALAEEGLWGPGLQGKPWGKGRPAHHHHPSPGRPHKHKILDGREHIFAGSGQPQHAVRRGKVKSPRKRVKYMVAKGRPKYKPPHHWNPPNDHHHYKKKGKKERVKYIVVQSPPPLPPGSSHLPPWHGNSHANDYLPQMGSPEKKKDEASKLGGIIPPLLNNAWSLASSIPGIQNGASALMGSAAGGGRVVTANAVGDSVAHVQGALGEKFGALLYTARELLKNRMPAAGNSAAVGDPRVPSPQKQQPAQQKNSGTNSNGSSFVEENAAVGNAENKEGSDEVSESALRGLMRLLSSMMNPKTKMVVEMMLKLLALIFLG